MPRFLAIMLVMITLAACTTTHEKAEPWHDSLAGPLLPKDSCPEPASNSTSTRAAYTERMEAAKLRFTVAFHSAEPLTQQVFAEDQDDMERLSREIKEQKADIRTIFWPICIEENEHRRFETIALLEKIGAATQSERLNSASALMAPKRPGTCAGAAVSGGGKEPLFPEAARPVARTLATGRFTSS